MILAESPRRQRVAKLLTWGHWFALVNIFVAIAISSIFIFSSPFPNSILGGLYMFCNWLGHISFLIFFSFVIFILPLCHLAVSPKTIKTTASIIAAVGLALLAFDALIFNKTGFHISSSSADLLKIEARTQINQFNWHDWAYLLLLFLIWFGFQLVLANAIWKRLDRFHKKQIAGPLVIFFVVNFVCSHAMHVWADAALYQPVIKQDNMFPLSYPATAKTTMSRYGLLNIESYQQRKKLQFNSDLYNVNYPQKPVYCSVNNSQKAVVLIQIDDAKIPEVDQLDLRKIDNYYSTSSSKAGLLTEVLYGLPEIYGESLKHHSPILLALTQEAGLDVAVYREQAISRAKINQYQSDSLLGHDILIAFVSAQEVSKMLQNESVLQSNLIVATNSQVSTELSNGTLYSNLALKAKLASTEDIVPTLLHTLGCNVPTEYYSTGQNLAAPNKNWLVSTSGEKVVVIYNGLRIDVLSNGSYEISSVSDGSRTDEKLNTDLLSQAIKHLTLLSAQH